MPDLEPASSSASRPDLEALHKELLAEYLRQRALLDSVFEADPGGLAVLAGQQLTLAFANPAYRFLCPQNGVDLIGQRYADIWESETSNCFEDKIHEVIETGRPFITEGFWRHFPDGEARIFTLQARRIPWDGEPAALLALWDTTEQVQAKNDLQIEVAERQTAELHLQEANERLVALIEASAGLLEGIDPVTRLNEFFQAFSDRLKLDVYVQYNLGKDGAHLELGSWAGFPEKYKGLLDKLKFGQAVCGTVAQTRQPMAVNFVQESTDPKTKLIRLLGVRTYACHPLIVKDRLLGTLSFGSRRVDSFNAETMSILRTFCHLVAAAMDRKQTEEALVWSKARLSAMLAEIQEKSALMDIRSRFDPSCQAFLVGPDLVFQFANSAYRALTPHPDLNPIGQPYDSIWRPEDGFCQRAQIDEVLRTGEDMHLYQHARRYTDGSTRYFNFHIYQVMWQAQPAIYLILLETTEQVEANKQARLSEERYRAILDSIQDGFFEVDREWRFTYANSRAATNVGLEAEALIGKNFWEVYPAIPGTDHERHYRQVMETRQPDHFEISGALTEKAYNIHIYPSQQGITVYWADITGYRKAEDEARSQAVQIELQHRLLAQREEERLIIARDLHDGPMQELTAVEYALADLAASTEDETLAQGLRDVREAVKNQVAELRLFASQLRPPTLTAFGLGKAIHAHLDSFRERHPDIYVSFQEEQEGNLLPDGLRLGLYRIYQEALMNVVKHSQATRVWVRLNKKCDAVSLEIEDNGIGFEIPQNWLDLARQGHLGLAGMRERAEAIGGTLDITSSPGHGTCLRVDIPIDNLDN